MRFYRIQMGFILCANPQWLGMLEKMPLPWKNTRYFPTSTSFHVCPWKSSTCQIHLILIRFYSEYLQCSNPKSNQWLTWKLPQWVEARNRRAGRGHIKIRWTVLALVTSWNAHVSTLLQRWLLRMLGFGRFGIYIN